MNLIILAAIGVLAVLALTPAGRAWLRTLAGSELGALTLAEAAKLSNDIVLQGVYESVIKASDISLALPYVELQGNAISYNRENVAPTVAWFAVGDTWTEGTATFTLITKQLCIVGGDADVDRYVQLSRSNVQDIQATTILGKAQALQREWDDKIINGSGAANQPDGLDLIVNTFAASQKLTMGTNGATLTMTKLDSLIDAVQGSKPDALIMSKQTRRTLNGLARTAGSMLISNMDEFGRFVQFYNGIPILLNDWISDAQTVGTSTDCSVAYAVTFGEENGGLFAFYNSGGAQTPIMVENVGPLETKDATRTRVKAYVQLAIGSAVKCARLNGIRP
jgi:hypothetical protein